MIQRQQINSDTINYTAITARGHHTHNQDAYTITPLKNHLFFAIADGLGSIPHAEYASRTVINHYEIHLQKSHDLTQITQDINTKLINQETQTPAGATTIVACLLNTDTYKATILHLGDSRAYLFNNQTWKTTDHTLVQELVDMNIITLKQAHTHPERNRLSSALGINETITPTITTKNLNHTRLLLSSDGLHDYVSDEQIQHIVTSEIPEIACQTLLQKAQENKSSDDITIIIATINL